MRAITSIALVAAMATPVAAEKVSDIVSARAAAELPAHLGLLAATVPASVAELDVRKGDVVLRWRRGLRPGNATVAAEIDGRKTWVRLTIGERTRVIVAARPLVAGGVISAGDLRAEVRTVGRKQGWRLEPPPLIGSEILADAATGAIIDGSVIAEPAPIARGARVAVQIKRGRLLVSTPATLERAARPGELAQLRLHSTRRIVRARLLSAGRARLEN